ncbi:MAG: putative sulfate/molybdate transporter [Desulfovibrio sp.]|jgi:MFS superfamily sulfate permease-like transporter
MKIEKWRFGRRELAGSLGDLGTLLPLAVGMVMINGLDPVGLFFSVGLLYVLGGIYYDAPIAVQPMKVVGAYAVATAATAGQITATGWIMAALLLVLGITGLVDVVAKLVPRPVVRGVQLSTGLLLMSKAVAFLVGSSSFQAGQGLNEPWLTLQAVPVPGLGEVPIGLLIGPVLLALTLLFLDSKRFPAGILVVAAGLILGLLLGGWRGLAGVTPGLHLPSLLPFGPPQMSDLLWALPALALPQLPMTVGNAVIANRDLSHELFPETRTRVTDRALCISMGLANAVAALLGGMPLCHGAGGLAAHYRFGARTNGSNLIIGTAFVLLAVVFGAGMLPLVRLLPFFALGVLLFFAGGQLALTAGDLQRREDLFTALSVAAVALGSNLAWGFGAGIVLGWLVRRYQIRM